ncbi:heme biosynthesis HemY N-terminal domain-containing protein [Albidovulum sp.]
MIWSFLKILLFVAGVSAVTLWAGTLAETGAGVRITLPGHEFTLGPVQLVVALVVVTIGFWIVFKLLGLIGATIRFLNGDETAISRYFDRNRERKGYQALAEGMMALASGEGRLALSSASKAERYLRKPELTNLLSAQAAELAGDTRKATEIYKRLLGDERTRFVGIRGLMKQKLKEGDTETAMKLAEKAFLMKPKHQEVQDTLLRLQTEAGDWAGARKVIGEKLRQGLLPRDVYRRRDAVLALQEAKDVVSEETGIDVKEAAIAANKLSPDLIPAAVMAARAYIGQGKKKYAARVLRKAWESQPHPDLAAAFAEIEPEETPAQRLARFASLVSANPEHEESKLLMAELHIAAEDFPGARRALGDLAQEHPTARVLTILAAIARGEGEDDSVVRSLLTQALGASRGPRWVCDNCQHVHAEWRPTCENCGAFDTLSWREPPPAADVAPEGAGVIPILIGTPRSQAEAAPGEEAEEEAPLILDEEVGLDEELGRKGQI